MSRPAAKDGSVLPDSDFAMSWEVDGSRKTCEDDRPGGGAARTACFLATDPDSRGRGDSWHVNEVLNRAGR